MISAGAIQSGEHVKIKEGLLRACILVVQRSHLSSVQDVGVSWALNGLVAAGGLQGDL